MDLSLVPLQEMIDEIEKRHIAYVIAVLGYEVGNTPLINTYWKDDKFIDCLGLCSALDEDLKQHYMREPKEEA